MRGIYNYIPETNNALTVDSSAAILYLQSVLHVMLFRMLKNCCNFTSVFPTVCVRCPDMASFCVP